MKECILVSQCLLGENTKYNGGNNYIKEIEFLKRNYEIIPVCPEVMGGLSTPRNPSEIQGDRVVSSAGVDVTKEFNKGAEAALELVKKYNIKIAVLKESSPSCGSKTIYDGSFQGKKILGSGVTTTLLKLHGVRVYSEHNMGELYGK